MESELRELIERTIRDVVSDSNTTTVYRQPLVGFASAEDKRFQELPNYAHPQHLMPQDLLPGAKTVIAFFVPFTLELSETNRHHQKLSREWAVAYVETNDLIGQIGEALKKALVPWGVACTVIPATHNYDRDILMARWSHRHVAHIAGLGTFGMNNMLITKLGCAGRYGSLVIDHTIEPTVGPTQEYCYYKKDGSCGDCFTLCPIGALTPEGFDRHSCQAYLRAIAEGQQGEGAVADACGKCNNALCAVFEVEAQET